MNPVCLQISSGRGPIEVRWFVAALADALTVELAARGGVIETRATTGPDDAPASVSLSLRATPSDVLSDLEGTHACLARSPRRGQKARKRWYAGVTVHAEPPDTARAPALEAADLEITACRSGGAGGQHVNTTSSAVMVLHRPTGLRVRAEGERSQHQNRSTALARLAALLAERAEAATAHATAERRLAHDRLERGAPVAVWAPGRTGLVRVDGEGPPPRP